MKPKNNLILSKMKAVGTFFKNKNVKCKQPTHHHLQADILRNVE